MLSDFPNFAFTLGYTNASWTLKADLVAEYVCRLLNHMDTGGYAVCVPRITDSSVTEEPLLDFNSGYVLRALAGLPKQGSKEPWKLKQSYPFDLRGMRFGPLEDGTMQFLRQAQPAATQVLAAASSASS
jgi:monooxygenase